MHHGRIVKRTGDGSIIEFRSVVDAVNCAIEVQRAMVERNAGVAPDKRIEFRVGVHLGDVVEEADGDLMGDGVNIASRLLEGVCEPRAGVCRRRRLHRQVKSAARTSSCRPRSDAEPQEHRRARARLLAAPRRACGAKTASAGDADARRLERAGQRWWLRLLSMLLAAGAYACSVRATRAAFPGRFRSTTSSPTRRGSRSIVLPFENLAGDPEQQYFADGITDDLTIDLSHVPDSFVYRPRLPAVLPRSKAGKSTRKRSGRELGVRYMLEGSVRRAGEKVEINAQLISTETGAAHVWSRSRFEGEEATSA